HRPDDVLGSECGIAAEEHPGPGRLHRLRIDLRHAAAVELDADVALDPREGVLLADRDQHVVAGKMLVRLPGRHELAIAFRVVLGPDFLEQDTRQPPVVARERLGHHVIEDRDALVHRVLLLPGGRLHFLEPGADHDFYVLAAEPSRGAAAVHCGVAAAEHDHALSDPVDVAERAAPPPAHPHANTLCP